MAPQVALTVSGYTEPSSSDWTILPLVMMLNATWQTTVTSDEALSCHSLVALDVAIDV